LLPPSRHVLSDRRNRRLSRLETNLFVQFRQRTDEGIALTNNWNQCANSTVNNPPSQFDEVQIDAIKLVFGKANPLDNSTANGRDALLATTMVQQFQKPFPDLLTATRTEVQILETDRFQLRLSAVMPVCFGIFVADRRTSAGFLASRHVLLRIQKFLHLVPNKYLASHASPEFAASPKRLALMSVATATMRSMVVEIVSRSNPTMRVLECRAAEEKII
jgi:hypothetical protein